MRRDALRTTATTFGCRTALALAALAIVGACSGGSDSEDQVLRPAGEVIAGGEAEQAVRGEIGEPARLTTDLGQDVAVAIRSVEVGAGPHGGRRLVVDLRVENDTDEAQDAPEIELWCGERKESFFAEGTFEWDRMPPGTFLEGTREFSFPGTCAAPELRAVPLVHRGESVRWDVSPR